MQAKTILASIFTILIICIFPHLGLIPLFGYSIPILLMVWFYLKRHGEKFSDIGFNIKALSFKSVLVGILVGVLVFSFLQLAFFPVIETFVTFEEPDVEIYSFITQGIWSYLFILLMGWIIGGLYEEIVFHGFIFTRFEKIFRGKNAIIISFFITNIIFAFYHIQLGAAGVLNAFLAGMAYNALALYFKRNLWFSVFCHGTYNTLVISFIYFELF